MGTSSARPDDLDAFVRGSRGADDELRDHATRLQVYNDEFQAGSSWGSFDASSLLTAYGRYVDLNDLDARWVARIAAAFRHAGGDGSVARLPDAAIAATLRAAGLGGARDAVTFDDPVAYGFPATTGYADDPVNTASGNFLLAEADLPALPVTWVRTYNSRSDLAGAFGAGWSSWADARLRDGPDGASYAGPDGQRAFFPRQGSGYGRVLGVPAELVRAGDGLRMRWLDGRRWRFDGTGRPIEADRIRFGHTGGRLTSLTHRGGRRIDLTWTDNRVTAAESSDGRRVDYTYVDGVLVTAGDHRYEVAGGRVVAVTDADGVTDARNTYDADGRVLTQVSRFGRLTRFVYLPGGVTATTGDAADSPANVYVHDPAGRLLAVVDGNGQRLSRTYDEWGNPVTVTDRNGAVSAIVWDDRGRPVRRVEPDGTAFAFRHDDHDRVAEVSTSAGGTVRYHYPGTERTPDEVVDAEGGVTRMDVRDGLVHGVTDPDGVMVTFGFDADGALVSATDAFGNTARLERDAVGRVVAAVTPLGRRSRYAYDARGCLVERGDPAGGVWRYEYTPGGRPVAVVDPAGARAETGYGPHGEIVSTVDPLGATTLRHYDDVGEIVRRTTPDGAEWAYGYDALARLTTVTDPLGGTWRREYDATGNLTGTVDPTGVRRTATLDPSGRVTGLDDGATSTDFEYDGLGRAVAQRTPDGAVARASYDRCGRRTAIADPAGGVTRLEYTPAGRLRRSISPAGRTTTYEYDAAGRPAARIDGAGRRWEFRHDADGALVSRRGPDGLAETFGYDDAGRLVTRQTSGSAAVRYGYDATRRPAEEVDAAGAARRFRYDQAGRLVEAIDPAGHSTHFRYDATGRLVSTVDTLGGVTVRGYDLAGRLIAETDPLGRTTSIEYDAAGRPVSRIDGAGLRARLSYDRSGRVDRIEADGAAPVSIERDALGRPAEIHETGSFHHRLRWDPAGRLIERRRDGLGLRWRYGPDGERAAVGYPDGSETEYTYDGGGLVTAVRHPGVGEITLSRDEAGRPVGADGPGLRVRWRYEQGLPAGYEFAAGDRRRTAELRRDPAGRVTAANLDGQEARFAYDHSGQLRQDGHRGDVTCRYDGAGRRISAHAPGTPGRTYRWDGLGRLTGVTDGDRTTVLTVDALGELAEVDGVPLLWDSTDPAGMPCWLGDRAVIGFGSPWATVTGGDVDWLLPDWLGTVGAAPDAWGGTVDDSPGIGFRGEVQFGSLVWLRNRVYDTTTHGFLSPDPLPPMPGTPYAADPYHYAGNDPIGRADPLGLRPVTDADLRKYRDQMSRDVWSKTGDWVGDNWEYIAAGALIVGGVLVMATGVGGPIGAAMIGGALLSAGGSTAVQKFTTGDVDWGQVAVAGLIGGAAGGIGAAGGLLVGSSARVAAASPFLRGAVTGGVSNLVGGAANRGLAGDDALNPAGLATDLLLGGATGGLAGRAGAGLQTPTRAHTVGRLPSHLLGETDSLGRITIQHGLSPTDFTESLRHETVHSVLTPANAGLRRVTLGLYKHSHLYKYTEEAAAETYGTLSVFKGLSFPLTHDYEINPLRLGAEALGVGAAGLGGLGLEAKVFGDD